MLKSIGRNIENHFPNELSTKKIPLQWRGLEETFLIQMMKFSVTNNGTNRHMPADMIQQEVYNIPV